MQNPKIEKNHKTVSRKLLKKVKKSFKNQFGSNPLLVFSPGRINLIGEHTDYNGGYVFPAAINKGIALAIQKSHDPKSMVYAIDKKEKHTFQLNNIQPLKKDTWKNYVLGIVVEIQNLDKKIENFNIAFAGNLPSGAGMSSSAALENSVVFGLNELFCLELTKKEMILISQKAEHNYVGVHCGIMDQYASMFGIKNNALLLDCKSTESKPYKINFKEHQFVLINTNAKHNLATSAYNDRRSSCEHVAKKLDVETLRETTETDLKKIIHKVSPANYQKALYVIQEIDRTIKAAKAIENNDLKTLGSLLYQSHNGLSNQYKVSCDELDFLVTQAKKNKKVLGARMMGGGFGGCTINLVSKSETNAFTKTVSKSYKEKFNKECSVYKIKLTDGVQKIKL
jgi:galactokinase